jgi:hypothetical protein
MKEDIKHRRNRGKGKNKLKGNESIKIGKEERKE